MENNKLEKLVGYLPYGLKIWHSSYKARHIWDINIEEGIQDRSMTAVTLTAICNGNEYLKPILRPLSDMTKEINYGLSSYIFTEIFEIGDTDGFIYEFDNGNIKLIQLLESISNHNSFYDINYLPYPVVQMMYQYHYDIHGLIESGEAIDINTL